MLKRILAVALGTMVLVSCGLENDHSDVKSGGTSTEEFKQVPSSCLAPRDRWGSRCSFYRECLETSIACEGTNYPYALSYGEKYCNKFEDLSWRLSDKGRGWLNDTLYCLQEAVPLWDGSGGKIYNSCQGVRQKEFSIHPACYLGGPARITGRSHTSICELPWKDSAKVVLTVSPGDIFTRESGKQVYDVARVCVPIYLQAPPLVSSPDVLAEYYKTRDFWKWAQAKGEAESQGSSAPTPPASIAPELGDLS